MRSLFAAIVTCIGPAVGLATAQVSVLEPFNPISAKSSGVHLYGATMSSAYFSNSYGMGGLGLSGGGIGLGGFGGSGLGSDSPATMLQGAVVFGWSRTATKWSGNVTYSPTYVRAVQGPMYRSLNHTLSASFGRTITRKWKMLTSMNGIASDFSQLLFAGTQYGNISMTPATFEEFFAAVLTGSSPNPALTQAVSSARVVNSPEVAYLYGDRLLSTAATLSVSYAHSSRSTLSMSIGAGRTEPLSQGASGSADSQNFFVSRTSSGTASIGWSYSLTPRTTLSVNMASTRSISTYQDSYNTQATVSIGRTLSRRWFVHATGGVGKMNPLRTTFAPSNGAEEIYGGGLGYKVASHTFVASYLRSASDVYGLGANTSESGNGAWAWKRPGRTVSASATLAYSRLKSAVFTNSGSWMGQVSVGKALGRHLALSVRASYTEYPRTVVVPGVPNQTQAGVMTTVSWSPSERE